MKRVLIALNLLFLSLFGLSQSPSLSRGQAALEYRELLALAADTLEADPGVAMAMLEEAMGKIPISKDPVSLSEAYFLMGEAHYYQDNLDQAIGNYQKAVETDIKHGNDRTPAHINLLGNLGFFYDTKDQKVIAAGYYERALGIARKIGDQPEIAANLANLGQLLVISGDYEKALEYMEEALAIDRALGDESVIATDLNTIGRLYESWGMFDKAADYLREALDIDKKLGNTDKIAVRYNSLGLVYRGWGKYEEALGFFNEALRIDRELQHSDRIALRIANIGATLLDMGDPAGAVAHLEESARFFESAQMPSYLAQVLNDLGRAYFKQKNYTGAEISFRKSIAISRQQGLDRFRMTSLESLSLLYEASGNLPGSLKALREHDALKDSLFNVENSARMAEFHARYELDKKQKENEILLKDQEISRERQIIMVLAFSLTGLFLFSVILALVIRLKMQQNRRLITQQENERLHSDLEQRNKELTYKAMCIIRNNETVARMVDTLEQSISTADNHQKIRNIIYNLQHIEHANNWKEFEVHFIQTHKDFYEKLHARFPELTPNEKKLCAFLRLNMTTKDIAAITHQSVHSIMVARTRLRKKLGIVGTEENLVKFLSQL